MRTTGTLVVAVLASAAGLAQGSETIYGVNAAGTTTVMHGGDRELTLLSFGGSPTTMSGGDFLRFTDGRLTNNMGTFNWSQQIRRDVDSRNDYFGNPDRADNATPYGQESQKKGTLAEVFGSFGSGGHKNFSYLIDGEDVESWSMDLKFAQGFLFNPDNNPLTVELAVLERGGNSDFKLYGLKDGSTVTGPIVITRAQTTAAGWNLNTLEIGDSQPVEGVGISLDSSWSGIDGIRFVARDEYNGPDPIAFGLVPTPGSLALLAAAGLITFRRRR